MANASQEEAQVYDFLDKKVYCFSDLEGVIPAVTQKTPAPCKLVCKILTDSGITDDEGFIFSGDLIDNGPSSIRLLQRMLDLKNAHPKSIILAAGNRDVNKLRFADELFITKKDGNLPWNDKSTLKDLLESYSSETYEFKYAASELKGVFEGTKEPGWSKLTDADFTRIFCDSSIPDRVKNIYKDTMGAGPYPEKYWPIEGKALFGNLFPAENDKQLFLLALLNMVMSIIWPENVLPEYFNSYNGLYVKYLQQTHIIAVFKHQNRYGFVSHGGVPIEGDQFVLPDAFGYKSSNSSRKSILTKIAGINKGASDQYTKFTSNNVNLLREDADVVKLFRMTANVGEVDYKETLKASSTLSPVVSMSSIASKGPKAIQDNEILNNANATNTGLNANATNTGLNANATRLNARLKSRLNAEEGFKLPQEKKHFFNIFGHQPSGYVPEVGMIGTNIFHVDLDISKAELAPDDRLKSESMAVLVLNDKPVTNVTKGYSIANNDKVIYGNVMYGTFKHGENIFTYQTSIDVYAKQEYGVLVTGFDNKQYLTYANGFTKEVVPAPNSVTNSASYNRNANTLVSSERKTLIVTTGDTSDADGFISVALYAKTGANLLFIINIPSPYNPNNKKGEESCPKKPAMSDKGACDKFNSDYKNAFGKGFNYCRDSNDAIKHVKMCQHFVQKIWDENKPKGSNGQLFFYFSTSQDTIVKSQVMSQNASATSQVGSQNAAFQDPNTFFYNDINPFGHLLSDDLLVYDYNALNIDGYTLNTSLPQIDESTYVYVDMNGSCAFYNEHNFVKNVLGKVKGLFIMGGIDAFEPTFTLNLPFLNRVPIATMNQVYAPGKAGNLIKDCVTSGVQLYFVSNNEVNKNGSYGKYEEKRAPAGVKKITKDMGDTVKYIMNHYYSSGIKDCKMFDPMTSLALIDKMKGRVSNVNATAANVNATAANVNATAANAANAIIEVPSVTTCSFGTKLNFERKMVQRSSQPIEYKQCKLLYDPNYGTTLLIERQLTGISKSSSLDFYKYMKEQYKQGNIYDSTVTGLNQTSTQAGGKKGSYSSRTLKELQSVAKKRGVVYSGLKKGDLIRKLREGKK